MAFQCHLCKRHFETTKGRNVHYSSCKRKDNYFNRRVNDGTINGTNEILDIENAPGEMTLQPDAPRVEVFIPNADIPAYVPDIEFPNKNWKNFSGKEFAELITKTYDEVIHWRKNLFKVPSGKAGKDFITELTSWLNHFNIGTDFRRISLKVFMTLPSLLLQKPSRNSKAKDHTKCLEERLKLWNEGNVEEILRENRRIQRSLPTTQNRTSEDSARSFAKLMWKGNVKAAIKMLTKDFDNGVLQIDDAVLKDLEEKHPKPAPIHEDTLLHGPIGKLPRGYFDSIDESMIATATRLTKGSGGPSQLDSEQFNHILLSKKFKKEGKDLREEIAVLARKLASDLLDPESLEPVLACRLIALNKNPGVRPIGIGEVLRRIIGKSVSWVLKDDVQEAAGPLQTATGLNNGAEAAIHAMREIFTHDTTDAVILVDAKNAFNSLNRKVALHNLQIICPPMSTIMINTYRQPSRLILFGSKEILSEEGTTQGDNLAMSFYALGLTPLLDNLASLVSNVMQVWLADDATGAGCLTDLKLWWDTIIDCGKKYGYYVNEGKSWIILKNNDLLQRAQRIFQGTSINFTIEGKRHLGAAIGSDKFRNEYVESKVSDWCDELDKLSEFAKSQPQAAYAAFVHGQQSKFNYFMRTIPEMEAHMKAMDEKIESKFLPALLDCEISPLERRLFSLPTRLGGLGIHLYAEKSKNDFDSSCKISKPLTSVIIRQGNDLPDKNEMSALKKEEHKKNEKQIEECARNVELSLEDNVKRALDQAKQKGSSSWLNVLPLEEHGFTLNKGEFRDAISLRYDRRIRNLPSHCPCGQKFSSTHALNCKRGGYVIMRHNQIRDFEANLLKIAHNDVEIEPELQPITEEQIPGLIGDNARPDIRARSVWRDGQNAYFDVRVTNVNCESQRNMQPEKILVKHEREKKRAYNQRIMNVEHGTFTPLVFSVTGGEGPETSAFHSHLAAKIASKTEDRYEKVITLIRCKLSFLILRSALACLRGSRPFTSRGSAMVDDFSLTCDSAGL